MGPRAKASVLWECGWTEISRRGHQCASIRDLSTQNCNSRCRDRRACAAAPTSGINLATLHEYTVRQPAVHIVRIQIQYYCLCYQSGLAHSVKPTSQCFDTSKYRAVPSVKQLFTLLHLNSPLSWLKDLATAVCLHPPPPPFMEIFSQPWCINMRWSRSVERRPPTVIRGVK